MNDSGDEKKREPTTRAELELLSEAGPIAPSQATYRLAEIAVCGSAIVNMAAEAFEKSEDPAAAVSSFVRNLLS